LAYVFCITHGRGAIYQFNSAGVIDRFDNHLKATPAIPRVHEGWGYKKWLYFVRIYWCFGL